MCKKHSKPGAGYLSDFPSDLPLPHEPSKPRHRDLTSGSARGQAESLHGGGERQGRAREPRGEDAWS